MPKPKGPSPYDSEKGFHPIILVRPEGLEIILPETVIKISASDESVRQFQREKLPGIR